MTIALKSANSMTAHVVCMAAGFRDGLRTAQYYLRDLSNADGQSHPLTKNPTLLSKLVGGGARAIDWLMSRGADISIGLLVPQWRNLPSPFAKGMRGAVLNAIQENRLVMTSVFTAYFFRAAKHILQHCSEGPYLVLEHRIDAARRLLEAEGLQSDEPTRALAGALLHLVEADPIARSGQPKASAAFLGSADTNLAVMAAACMALLFAEAGKPLENLQDDEFFAIAGALLAPRLGQMTVHIQNRDVEGLARELREVAELY